MKFLTLIRHGKSSWEFDVTDKERPLKKRGITDAQLVANEFIKSSYRPFHIFTSPANRALSTCKIFVSKFGLSENSFFIKNELYDFDGETVINFVKNLPNSYNNVMVFGHNHAFTSIANIYGNKFIDNLPTSGLITLKFDITNWQDLKQGTTELIIIPKALKQ